MALIIGLLTFACGAAVLACATGLLPTQPGPQEAPRWIGACAGIIFMAGALVPINAAFGLPNWVNQLVAFTVAAGLALLFNWVNQLVAFTVAAGLALLFNWVAFWPGERHFSATISVPGVQISGGGGQLAGRIMFGLGALLADTILALWIVAAVRRARTAAPS